MPGLVKDYTTATDEIQRVSDHCEMETTAQSARDELRDSYRNVRAMHPDSTPSEALQEAKHQITGFLRRHYATYEALQSEQEHPKTKARRYEHTAQI